MDNQCILLTWCLETGVDLDENSSCRLDGVERRGEERRWQLEHSLSWVRAGLCTARYIIWPYVYTTLHDTI